MIDVPGFCSSKSGGVAAGKEQLVTETMKEREEMAQTGRRHGPQVPREEETLPGLLSAQKSAKTSVWKVWHFSLFIDGHDFRP